MLNRRRFSREFWWIYEAVSKEEAVRFYEAFKGRWKQQEPEMVSLLETPGEDNELSRGFFS